MISATKDESYHKLIDLLESSTAYRADRILGRLPSEDMFEVRAILLGRLGRHEGALQIYVYQLENYATAEESVGICSVSKGPQADILYAGTAKEFTALFR